jgi:hypothetical protein
MDYSKLQELSRGELLEFIKEIRDNLESAEDARDYCFWLSDVLDLLKVDVPSHD